MGFEQIAQILYLQGALTSGSLSGATATGNGTAGLVAGYNGAQQVEIQELAGGTATVVLEGSFDGSTWYALGYQQIDGQATLSRATGGISVTANAKHVYQVLDPYYEIRARISAIAGGGSVMARVYMVPA